MNTVTKDILCHFYESYHKTEFINPDPLLFPRRYSNSKDVEAAAFISSSFALGRVGCIINFLEEVFNILEAPVMGLTKRSEKEIESDFKKLKYRFYSGADIVNFFKGLRLIYINYGSLENCFNTGYKIYKLSDDRVAAVISGLAAIADAINTTKGKQNIVADPHGGSACKRLFLFLRWVVRSDNIDPGGWTLPTSDLIIPLDTHITKIGRLLKLTNRKSADLKTAIDITTKLKELDANDPVKYDFSMSRIGIHPELSYSKLHSICLENNRLH